MQDVLIDADGVWKKYARTLSSAQRYGLKDSFLELVNRRHGDSLRVDEFWALRDASFSLRRGESLAVVGHNGAGKTTLLRILAGLLKPDRGTVTLNGRVERLIELSAGFHPALPVVDNLKLRARLKGYDVRESQRYVREAIEFAELEEFEKSPIQYLSAGMKARLGFASTVMSQPDILIIDEVLAVGDLAFRLKCYDLIDKLVGGVALVFVSHSMSNVSRLCNRGLLLEKGRVAHLGDVQETIRIYNSSLGISVAKSATLNPETVRFSLRAKGAVVEPEGAIGHGEECSVCIDDADLPEGTSFRLLIRTLNGQGVIDFNSQRSGDIHKNGAVLICELGSLELSPGQYTITLIAMAPGGRELLAVTRPILFRIEGKFLSAVPVQAVGQWYREGSWSRRDGGSSEVMRTRDT